MTEKYSPQNMLNRLLLVPLLVLTMLTPACMPKIPGVNQMNPEYYPACFQPFADLEKAQDELIRRTLIGAGIGVASGAAVGALASGDVKGAVIGGVGGLIAGGLLGYGTGKMKQIKDDRERMRSYQADMNADMRNASRVEQYAMASMQCYTREFNTLLRQYRQGTISKAEVEARYGEIRRGLTYISEILTDSKTELTKRDAEYREAFASEARENKKTLRKVASLDDRRQSTSRKKAPATVGKNRAETLQQVNAEISKRQKNAERRTRKIEQQEAIQSAAAENKKGTSNINTVAKYYEDQYLDSIVNLEEAENVNQRTLLAMSVAAQHAGIDMV